MTAKTAQPEYLDVTALAAKFGVSKWVVYRGVKAGWPCAGVGGIKFSPAHVEAIEELIEIVPAEPEPVPEITHADIARAVRKTSRGRKVGAV